MAQYKRKGIFETFFQNRSSLIIQYTNGDITKKEFLEHNFDFVQGMNIKPFSKIDSFEKGMYNYQYYNVLAKYYTMLAKDIRRSGKHNKYYTYYKNMGNEYYHQKDRATLQLLRFLEFQNVEAYFIQVQSKFLQDKLYEIVLLDYKEAIFHSKSYWLLEVLKEEGVFLEGKKKSLIDEYINEKY
ncbi:conserved hypothetical protein [[Clostridium] ultunense Esp]|uniref:Uncharacterized protein n=1 Tax=[Clostridium] ultunense Esp TaxID=1288971 RepID=M1ZIY5_9FIRM|nr:DUF6648 family protein [Schnuerera ultunensis]CCQ98599.1 conserved hypothetical protein [[Clostridium] ultunense Esp]SHD77782.1 conserved protein of unknown function [[Clostridium] ultunense Esp]